MHLSWEIANHFTFANTYRMSTNTLSVSNPSPSSAFNFNSNFINIQGHKIHYVEVGEGAPILFVHGNPTSSYAYRNVLGEVASHNQRRCIALDLLGFGQSDKPNITYSLALHTTIIQDFIEQLDLQQIILVAEDWGGFLGSYVMTQLPERFESAVLMETFLWAMEWEKDFDPRFKLPFKLMRSPLGFLFTRVFNIMVNKLIPEHCPISDESLQYYKDSLPDFNSRKAMGAFPNLLPINGYPKASYDMAQSLQEGLKRIDFPVLWLKSDPGVVISDVNPCGMERLEALQDRLPQLIVKDFGPGYHFLTEENPEKVVAFITEWVALLKA